MLLRFVQHQAACSSSEHSIRARFDPGLLIDATITLTVLVQSAGLCTRSADLADVQRIGNHIDLGEGNGRQAERHDAKVLLLGAVSMHSASHYAIVPGLQSFDRGKCHHIYVVSNIGYLHTLPCRDYQE